jgi:transcriptional regulator with XRE-family HTH domain
MAKVGIKLPHLRRLRHERHLTQQTLADKAGMSKRAVEWSEKGNATTFPYIEKLAKALEVTVSELIGEPTTRPDSLEAIEKVLIEKGWRQPGQTEPPLPEAIGLLIDFVTSLQESQSHLRLRLYNEAGIVT